MEKINTVQDMKPIFHDPMAFIEDLAGPIAKQKLEEELSKRMEPGLQERGLTWQDVLPIVKELEGDPLKALGDPEMFFESLLKTSGPVVAPGSG